MKKRCVITGLGLVCPVGNSTDECWENIKNGKSGISEVKSVNTEGCYSHLGGEVSCDELPAPEFDRSARLCIKAADEAIKDAALGGDSLKKTGTIMGSCVGGAVSVDKFYTAYKNDNADNRDIPNMVASAIANNTAKYLGLDGVTANIVNACAAGTMSIAYACDLISAGDGDIFLAGGTDAFSSLAYAGFHALHALAEKSCSPLNKSNGITLGEGAGVLVVEEYEHAKKRGAKIYCEVSGYGVSSDAFHITAPHPQGEGQMSAISKAMRSAGVKPEEISYINAHGTGTAKNDEAEFLSLHTLFEGGDLSVSSTKSMTGHCLGAAGAIEAVISVKALTENVVPPTIGYDEEDLVKLAEKAGRIDFVANTAEKKQMNTVMSNSFAFGGTNASIIFSKSEHSENVLNSEYNERVFITGFGCVSGTIDGNKAVPFPIATSEFDARGVKMGFYRKLDRFSQLQLISGIDALKDAGITIDETNEKKVGIIIGTADGPMTEITEFQKAVCAKGTTAGSAFSFPNTVYNAAGGHLSIFTKAKGYAATVANGAQAGIQSVCYACDVLGKGEEQIMLATGNDEISENILWFYSRMGLPENYIINEASSSIVLETESSAKAHNARVYAEIKGTALTHCSQNDDNMKISAIIAAANSACKKAGITADKLSAIYGFKNGTAEDSIEEAAVAKINANVRKIEICEQYGDCRAASANMQVAEAAKAINDGKYEYALAISYGIGGSYSAVVLGRASI